MNNQEYENKKRECWEEYKRTDLDGEVQWQPVSRYDVFCAAFDRAYALGKETGTITQEDVEKAAGEYVYERQKIRHYAKREEDATMRDFDKTIKAWDAYDMEQAFESGANLFLGKQEKDADTVIQGWVARDEDENLFMYQTKPERDETTQMWMGGCINFDLRNHLFPDLTWDDEPQEVEIIIKRKKNG